MTERRPPLQSPLVETTTRAPETASATAAAATPAFDFRAVYETQFQYVWHSLRRLGVPDRDIEDLAHDVFVVLYRGRDQVDTARAIKPWLFGICFRVASDYRRRARHRFEVQSDHEGIADRALPADEQVAERQDKQLILDSLAVLDIDRRAVFVMHDLDGHAMPDIAAALGAPLNTCYSRLRLAREQFTAAVRRKIASRKEPPHE